MGFCGRPSTPSNSFSQKFFYSAWAKEPITLWKYNIPMFIYEAQLQCDVDSFRKILGSKIQIQWQALCAPALVTRHQLVKSFSIQTQVIEDSKHSSSEQQWFIFLEIELHSPSLWWTKRNPSSESEAQMSFALNTGQESCWVCRRILSLSSLWWTIAYRQTWGLSGRRLPCSWPSGKHWGEGEDRWGVPHSLALPACCPFF